MEQKLQPQKQIRPAIDITIVPKVTILNGIQCPKISVTVLNKTLSLLESSSQIEASDINLVYITIPNKVVDHLKGFVTAIPEANSYEDILKYFMDLSIRADNPLSKAMKIAKIDDLFGEKMVYNQTCAIKNWTLAIIWSALILSIYKKYNTEMTDAIIRKILRGGIAFSLTFGVMLMQYEHNNNGSPTNYLRKLCNQYHRFREQQSNLPDLLNLDKLKTSITEVSSYDKLRMGQLFNMVYTFRIGDCFISNLTYNNSDIMKILQSAWPIPNDTDISKIYQLYTEDHIY